MSSYAPFWDALPWPSQLGPSPAGPASSPEREPAALPIYLDHNATTPIDPRVVAVMLPYLSEHFGNAASRTHVFGRTADHAVEVARQQVAGLIGAGDVEEVSFTPGATYSNAMALTCSARLAPAGRDHIITSNVEHQSLLAVCVELEKQGLEITRIPVNSQGLVDPGEVAAAITERTFLVSVMLAQNVIGTIQPIAEIGTITRGRDIWLHVDAAQGVGLVPLDVEQMGIDMASLSAHKFYGPKGIGALYVRHALRRAALERDHKDAWTPQGTLNVPAIVGCGCAAALMAREGKEEASRLAALRDRLLARLSLAVPMQLNGALHPRHPGNLNISIPVLHSVELAALREKIAISHGSACSSSASGASHVLLAAGVPEAEARTAIRIGIGRFTTMADIDATAERIIAATRRSEERTARAAKRPLPPRMVVNCEGRRVQIRDDDAAMCAVSDADNYLVGSGEISLGGLYSLGKPARINIIIPSYCSGPELGETLRSLLDKRFPFRGELVVFINESAGATPEALRNNEETERWIHALASGRAHAPERFRAHHQSVRDSLARLGSTVKIHCIRQMVRGGMPAVYQLITSSYVHRLRAYHEHLPGDRARKSRQLEESSRRTFVMICDDDVQIGGTDALERAYFQATVHDAVVLGQLRVDAPPGGDIWDELLCRVLQVFLDIKHALNATALSPRGLLVRHIIEAGNVDLGDPFGDQLYFARLAADRPHCFVTGRTSIREVDYPSNGRFLRDLKRYISGLDNNALHIFYNLLDLVAGDAEQRRRWTATIEALIAALQTRNRDAVAAFLNRQGDHAPAVIDA